MLWQKTLIASHISENDSNLLDLNSSSFSPVILTYQLQCMDSGNVRAKNGDVGDLVYDEEMLELVD